MLKRHNSDKEPQERKCTRCGSVLEVVTKVSQYDDKTGEPLYRHNYKCPNKRLFNGHDEYWEGHQRIVVGVSSFGGI